MTDDAGQLEPQSRTDIDPLADLAEEFVERYQRGERPTIEEYAEAHPLLAEEIRDLFPALVVMERLAPESGDQPVPEMAQQIPESVGDYRIVREVGRGGMGIVYEAEQQSLRRRVALKVLTRSISNQATAQERFQREAQSAAQLHHQNIVPVFDVGQQDGTWYYAMQFIRGLGLDEVLVELKRIRDLGDAYEGGPDNFASQAAQTIIDGGWQATQQVPKEEAQTADESGAADDNSHQANIDSSLSLMSGDSTISESQLAHHRYYRSVAVMGVQVARALAYAHERGIVHRDIKPSNLLLDAQANVWVTDFGLAKAEDSNLTQTGDIVGTIGYMAPERFQGWSDPRSDIYGLGITLCELLILRPVFTASDRVALIHLVTHQEPARPRSIDRQIPPDLETIVLKAIAKEPADRYLTAGDFADDLERFIQDKPIRARRNGQLERTWRWCRRNTSIAVLACTLLITMIAGILGMTLLWLNATEQRDMARRSEQRAIDEQAKAEQLFDRATEIVEKYYLKVDVLKLANRPGMQPLRKELLSEAMEYFEWLADQHGNNPRLQSQIAVAHWRIGDIEADIGTFEKAEAAYQRSIATFRSLISADARMEDQRRLAGVFNNLGALQMAAGNDADAIRSIQSAVQIRKDLVARKSTRAEVFNLAKHYSNLAALEWRGGRLKRAQAFAEREVDLFQQLVVERPEELPYLSSKVKALRALGMIRRDRGDTKGAMEMVERAHRDSQDLVKRSPHDTEYQLSLARSFHSRAVLSKDSKSSLRDYQRAIQIGERLIKESPDVHLYRKNLAYFYFGFAGYHKNYKRSKEAKTYFQKCVRQRSMVLQRNPSDFENQHNLGLALFRLAVVERNFKDFATAEKSLAQAASFWRHLVKHGYATGQSRYFAAKSDLERIITASEAGKLVMQDFDQVFKRLVALSEQPTYRDRSRKSLVRGHDRRAVALIKLGRYDDALADIQYVVANNTGKRAAGNRLVYAKLLVRSGDYQNAVAEIVRLESMSGFSGPRIIDAAIVCDLSSGLAAADKTLPASDREKRAAAYSDRALEYFQRLHSSEFEVSTKLLSVLRTTKHLKRLRKRPEFIKLLDSFSE